MALPKPGLSSTPSERVVWLLATLWGGNRSEMARAIGCSHTVLTKIAAGLQSPGTRLLSAIAQHPKINPAWLLSGDGEPLLQERADTPTEGWPLPISRQLLPGAPDEFRSMLSGETFPIAGAFFRETRYWFQVQRGEPVLRDSSLKLDVGDLLLLDANTANLEATNFSQPRLCAIKRVEDEKPCLRLGQVVYVPETREEASQLSVMVFYADPKKVKRRFELTFDEGKPAIRELSPIIEKPGNEARRIGRDRLGQHEEAIMLSDVVAVCQLVVRRLW